MVRGDGSCLLGSLFIYSKIVFPLLLNWAIYNEALDAAADDAAPCLSLRHVITLASLRFMHVCVRVCANVCV